jgi:EmrB/QacA subfamily drug resistance transporter
MVEMLIRQTRGKWALTLIASAQFMLVLDITIVMVALPTIQQELELEQGELQYLMTAYALAFGGFLLLAGGLADVFGRLRMFVVGVLLFGAASLVAGLAVNDLMLVAGRASQGLGGAAVSPAALALLTTTFPEGGERNRALGVFGAVASAGGASGLILGGAITEWAGWRWIFLVNVPLTAAVAIAAPRILQERRDNSPRRLDLPGALLITLALAGLVYGLARGDRAGFDDGVAIASLGAAIALGATFAVAERRAASPLVPLHLLRLPTLLGTDLTALAVSALVSATPFFLTLYLQVVLGLSPIETGLAFLPMALTIIVVSAIAARLTGIIGVKPLLLIGLVALIFATLLLSAVSTGGSYLVDVLPGMTFFAVGLACSYTTATIGGTAGVPDADQGVAGGLLNTFNQVGGAVGLAVLAAVATGSDGAVDQVNALVEGLRAAFVAALAFAALGAVAALTLIREHDCQSELARRQREQGAGSKASNAGCLAGLGERIIDER